MRAILLAAAAALAAAIPAAPAAAEHRSGSGPFGHFGSADGSFGVVIHRGDGGRRGRGDTVVLGSSFYYGGEWALHNNRSFAPDSYNDWWHDNPDRAFPRWVTSGQCSRQWFAGDTLRC